MSTSNCRLTGITLGLTGIIVGIILPYHLRRTGVISFPFIPEKSGIRRTVVTGLGFAAFYLLVFPSGFLGSKTTFRFFASPPPLVEGGATFVFLLLSAIAYALIFWGGLLPAITKVSNKPVAVIITSALFSIYHISQFPFCPMTFSFFAEMFVCAVLLNAFTAWAGCVLPALVVAQVEQFFYFAARQNNPFSEPAQAFSGMVLLFFVLGIYTFVSQKLVKE
ncbi:MAG: hypothetical protein GY832_45770 [Chloroflexi bacterium]|nr:hypothetical protein [Chloroflexota bacterium]